MNKNLIVFFDCGDTLIDESRQVVDEGGVVHKAEPIEGAVEMLRQLHAEGYRMALVADGKTKSFDYILDRLGVAELFETRAVSQELGGNKPNPRMFRTAMERMGLTDEDLPRIVMVGNNLERDIVGANRMGITSILISFTPRYPMVPRSPEELPDYVIAMPCELPPLLEQLERQVHNRRVLGGAAHGKRPIFPAEETV